LNYLKLLDHTGTSVDDRVAVADKIAATIGRRKLTVERSQEKPS